MKLLGGQNQELVKSLFDTIQMRRECEKKERELKIQVRKLMGQETLLEAGEILVLLRDRIRRDLDKDLLKFKFGAEFVKSFEVQNTYQVMDVFLRSMK